MKPKEITIILSFAFILIVAWIGFNIYHNRIMSTISELQNARIQPINSNFDTYTIDKLKKRQKVSTSFESTSQAIITDNTVTPPPSSPSSTLITVTPSPSPSSTITPSITQSIISITPTP